MVHVPSRRGVLAGMKLSTFTVFLLAASASAFAADAPVIQPSLVPTPKLAALDLIGAQVVAASSSGNVFILENSDAETRAAYTLSSGKLAKLDIAVPKQSAVAVCDEYMAWIPTNPKAHRALSVYSIATGSRTELSNPPYVSQMKCVGETLYVLHHKNRSMELSRLRFGDAVFEKLWASEAGQETVSLGNSLDREIVLIDPVNAHFRIDSIIPAYQPGVWRKIQSDIVENIGSQRSNVKFGPGVRGYSAKVLAHQSTSTGQVFVLAAGLPNHGQYAIATDNVGNELRRFVLGRREDFRDSFRPSLANVVAGKDSLTLWSINGQQLVFPGVR